MTFITQAGNNPGAGVLQAAGGHFIPEIWTSQLLENLDDNLVLGSPEIVNRQYEGEFRREGDVVRIPHFVDTVVDKGIVKSYGAIGTADRAQLEYIKMTVAKGSSFHLELDNLHQLQTKTGIDLMSNLIAQRARVLANTMDSLIAKTILAAVAGKDLNGTEDRNATVTGLPALHGTIDKIVDGDFAAPLDISVYDFVVSMLEKLDIKGAPQDRFLFISPKLRSALLRDPKFIDASHFGGGAVMPTGVIGSILGVPVRVANTLGSHTRPNDKLVKNRHTDFSTVDMFMGSTAAASLIVPFAEMQAYQPEAKFTNAIKSRVIYDAKVIRPEQLVVATGVEALINAHNAANNTP
ncbi:hypothetical protein [Streptomyces sp. ISL-87]|uniref:hypothetical protein n=1 Tax=Streptomyces sp. ISL-87 TaxID=2819188 RepID=UPI002035B7D3|nr:hypothetical protein [Streptomyces sp. ISL-87]